MIRKRQKPTLDRKTRTALRTMLLAFLIAFFAILWLVMFPPLTHQDLERVDIVPTSTKLLVSKARKRSGRTELVIVTEDRDYFIDRNVYGDSYSNDSILNAIVPGEPLTVWIQKDPDLQRAILGFRNDHAALDTSVGIAAHGSNRMWAMIVGGFCLACALGYVWHLRHTIRRIVAVRPDLS